MTESRTTADVADIDARWATLEPRLEAHAAALATQGTVVSKIARGRRVWVVRFVVREGGRRVHKAIYIGNNDVPELIERACALLEEYRRMGRWADEVEGYARLAARAGGIARHVATGRGRLR